MRGMRVEYPISLTNHFQSTFFITVAVVVVVDVVVVDPVEVVGVVEVAVAKKQPISGIEKL